MQVHLDNDMDYSTNALVAMYEGASTCVEYHYHNKDEKEIP